VLIAIIDVLIVIVDVLIVMRVVMYAAVCIIVMES